MDIETLMMIDSLKMSDKERQLIVDNCIKENTDKVTYENNGYLPHFKSIKLIKKANLLLNFTYN